MKIKLDRDDKLMIAAMILMLLAAVCTIIGDLLYPGHNSLLTWVGAGFLVVAVIFALSV